MVTDSGSYLETLLFTGDNYLIRFENLRRISTRILPNNSNSLPSRSADLNLITRPELFPLELSTRRGTTDSNQEFIRWQGFAIPVSY